MWVNVPVPAVELPVAVSAIVEVDIPEMYTN